MQEQRERFEVGQTVEWAKVKPYEIVQLVGPAGNIHISEIGHYHVFWHRELPSGQRVLIHHGGPEGFADLAAVKRQHERVILRYVGVKVEIPSEQQEDFAPRPNQTFPELAQGFDHLLIPGEQQLVNQWIGVLLGVSRDLPQATAHPQLSIIRDDLKSLLDGPLGRSINRHKRAAANALETGLRGGRGNLLGSVTETQRQLLFRAQESVSITLGTMQRYNDLERLQLYWNDIVNKAHYTTARATRIFQAGEVQGDLDRQVVRDIVNPRIGLTQMLAELRGEPYLSRAQGVIKSLGRIDELLDRRDHLAIAKILVEQTTQLEVWKRLVREQYVGVGFGRYLLE